MIDRCLMAAVEWRLRRFRLPGDRADRFADQIVKLMQSEVERRNRLYEGWNEAARERAAHEAEAELRQVAVESFREWKISGEEYRQ